MNNVVKIKPLKLTIDAQYSGNEDVNSDSFSFSGVAYSGGLVQNHSGFGSLIIDTANLKIEKEQTPIYFNHSSDSIIGFSEISVENNQIVLNGIISKNLDEGKRVQELNKLGFKWELSVGIAPTEISYAREGEIINGVTLTKDVAIFQKNTLFEGNTSKPVSWEVFNDYQEMQNMELARLNNELVDLRTSREELGKETRKRVAALVELNKETKKELRKELIDLKSYQIASSVFTVIALAMSAVAIVINLSK